MLIIIVWGIFIFTMSISIFNHEIDTFHYLLYSLVMLYTYYIFYQIKL